MLYQIPAFFQDTFLSCVLPSCLLSISHLVIFSLFTTSNKIHFHILSSFFCSFFPAMAAGIFYF